ncbi:MAG: alpha/beta fold hydrolase [Myxococcota bacterium]
MSPHPPALPSWIEPHMPFRRRLETVDGHRVHMVDEGEGPVVLLVHGNPTWSFLWRKVIARLQGRGVRCLAPDLLGFGLSHKPRRVGFHTLTRHADVVAGLVEQVAPDLPVTVVGQDWGGPIAAAAAVRLEGRVRAAVFGNTALLQPKRPLRTATFHRLARAPVVSDLLFRGLGFPLQVLDRVQGDRSSIGRLERRAYRWPLRRLRDRAGPLALARMVPDREGHPTLRETPAIDRWYREMDGPVSLVWGTRDPILGGARFRMRQARQDARYHETGAGHFIQEEIPELIADEILEVTRTSS